MHNVQNVNNRVSGMFYAWDVPQNTELRIGFSASLRLDYRWTESFRDMRVVN
jgi:hypothetical protein